MLIAFDSNSIKNWRTIYINEEMIGVFYHYGIGFIPSLIAK